MMEETDEKETVRGRTRTRFTVTDVTLGSLGGGGHSDSGQTSLFILINWFYAGTTSTQNQYSRLLQRVTAFVK